MQEVEYSGGGFLWIEQDRKILNLVKIEITLLEAGVRQYFLDVIEDKNTR